jgi:tripartite-type tricarboxylate transporter receptor subunit TctC
MMRSFWALAAALLTCSGTAFAQSAGTYPVKPVRVIVPFAPGGGTDVMSRAVSQKLTERLGATFVVDNRAGANGIIGVETATNAQPDGCTLVAISNSHTVNVDAFAAHIRNDIARSTKVVKHIGLKPE